ncbi:MAG: tetratricopeptide repeat protein [Bryobacterales bacterium]|nr:tetratricopeptide repeat protein [Bryobacterales bacterium]
MSKAKRPVVIRQQRTDGKAHWNRLLWAAAIAVALAAWIAYGRALHGPFVFDDIYLPMFEPPRSLASWMSGVRPVLMLSYWLNFQASGLEPFSYHVGNLALHLANSALVYLIVLRLLEWSRPDERRGEYKQRMAALFAAAVFLLHPLETESVAYVAGRSEALSVLFAWGAYALFLYRRERAVTLPVAAGVVVLFGLGVMSKEHIAVLPALLLATDYYWNPGFKLEGIRRNWKLYVPLGAAAAAGLSIVFRVLSGSDSAGFHLDQITPARYFFTQCRVIWVYVRMFVLPVGQNADHTFPLSKSILDHGAIFGLAALAGLAVAAWMIRKRFPLASFGVLVFLLLLAPTSSFVPIQDMLAERRTYLPMLGLLLVVADLVARWKASPQVAGVTLCAVAAALAAATYQRAAVWTSEVALWEDVTAKEPASPRAQFQLGFAYYQAGRCQEAASAYERAKTFTAKPQARLWVDWALALDCAGKPEEALAMLDREKTRYGDGHLYATLGMIAGKQGMAERALEALATAEQLNPNNEMIYFYRGNVFMTRARYAEAVAAYQKMLAIKPDVPGGREALAVALRQAGGGR